jgi:putative membrane protein
VIVGILVSKHLLIISTLTRKEIDRLSKINGIYGLSVLFLLEAGMTLRLGGYGKPTEFYLKNHFFI